MRPEKRRRRRKTAVLTRERLAADRSAGARLSGEDHLDGAGGEIHGYLTDPASSPCTKYRWNAKNTASGTTSEMNDAGAITSIDVPNSRS